MKQHEKTQRASDVVWDKIQEHEVRIRTPWNVWGERVSYVLLFVLTLLGGVLLTNLIVYWFSETRQADLLRLGPPGFVPFLEAVPYHWILLVVGFFLIGLWLVRLTDVSYRHSFSLFAIGLALIILLGGGLVARSRFNHHIVDEIGRGHYQPLRPFYDPPTKERQARFNLIGRVAMVGDTDLILTIREEQLTVLLLETTITPTDPIVSGDRIRVIGRLKDDGTFAAVAILKLADHHRDIQSFRSMRPASYL